MSLGACGLKKWVLRVGAGLCAGLTLSSCGSSKPKNPPSGLTNRVLASQSVTAVNRFGGLVIIDGQNDTLPRVSPISTGSDPGLMVITPNRAFVATFDSSANTVYGVDTTTEKSVGSVRLAGPTNSIVVPLSGSNVYAAVPTDSVTGYTFVGGIAAMDLTSSALITTIAVTNAQTVVSNASGTQLLVFSNDSDSIALVNPANAVPPVDTSCVAGVGNSVCTIIAGFDRPVYAVINGDTAYILNCGPQCGGTQASVMVFNLGNLTVTKTIPVDAATWAWLEGSTLYVAGTSPTNHGCTGQTTAATSCGRLDILNLNSGVNTASLVIADGYHDRMDMSINGQLFIGSHDCTEIGNVNTGGGEIRGCLTIYNTNNNTVLVAGDNGDVNGLQSFSTRYIEYVAQGGNLRVYDTTTDGLLINDFIPYGTINVVGYVGDVKAIDFF
jgi:hypothetical protein